MDAHTKKVLKNASKKVKEADKLSKKGLFNWNPDYNQAANLYEESAMLYRANNKDSEALKCYVSAADANLKCDNGTMAGKNYEDAGKLLLEKGKYTEAVKYFEKGHVTFYEDGKPERSVELLVKGANALDKAGATNEAICSLFDRGLEIMGDNEKYHYGMTYFQQYNSFLCRKKEYAKCIENILVQKKGFVHLKQPHNVHKANLAIVVLCLKMGDLAKADEYNDQFTVSDKGYTKTEEFVLGERLIEVCDARDDKALESVRKESKLKYIDPAVSRIGRKLTTEHMRGSRLKKNRMLDSDGEEEEDEGESDEEEEDDDSDGIR